MQNFVGYCMEINPKTRKLEKKWKECVANDRLDEFASGNPSTIRCLYL